MECLPGRGEPFPQASDIEAIVRIATVGRTSSRRDQPSGPEETEVVRDEVLGLAFFGRELAHPVIALRQPAQELPAQRVGNELEKLERRLRGPCNSHKGRFYQSPLIGQW